MCIVLLTTAHPDYALIILDNRDEFILRPTSKPHWWSSPASSQKILSSRDLLRKEQGTWLGITSTGNFAVLTNYRESNSNDAIGTRSRGGMVTAWLTASNEESTEDFVHRLLEDGEGVAGVGGFSLLCGKLRRRKDTTGQEGLESLAIISNRCEDSEDVPWIAGERGQIYGLSNTSYTDPDIWLKVRMGKEKLSKVVEETVQNKLNEEELLEKLFDILDTNTLPEQNKGEDFESYIMQLKESIFIPAIGSDASPPMALPADSIATADPSIAVEAEAKAEERKQAETETKSQNKERPDAPSPCPAMTGIYGTQRQTVILVDWDGNVVFRERALWDERGKAIKRGEGDMEFRFRIEGWEDESS